MRTRSRRIVIAAVLVSATTLSGCTGIPSSSQPEVINTVAGGAPAPTLAITPEPGSAPRQIVDDFLTACRYADRSHAAARGFLTSADLQRWNDSTVTVLDSLQVGNFTSTSATTGAVVVTGRRVGSLAANGVYSPELKGNGSGGDIATFPFTLKLVAGQWRIDDQQAGVIIDAANFLSVYASRVLYFFNLTEKHLVADLRYTPINDSQLLANWLVDQLASGPRSDLQTAYRPEMPEQAQNDPTRVGVLSFGSPTKVLIPGAAQLDSSTRNHLAAQLAVTLEPVASQLSIIDAGTAVQIPQAHGTTFTADDFPAELDTGQRVPSLYYLNGGRIFDDTGTALPGRANGQYDLTSVALSGADSASMKLAGTAATGPHSTALYVGTATGGLRQRLAAGALSRPAWAPDADEVWIGDGTSLYRVTSDGRPNAVTMSTPNGGALGSVVAVRFSPEGTRIALVLATADGASRIWVGSVVRPETGTVTVDDLEPISPQGVKIKDLAWNGQLKLFATGSDVATNEPGIYEVQVDGSAWTPRSNGNLPDAADSITIAENQVAWVSTGSTVWEQRAGEWVSPKGGQTPGTNPVYTE